MRKALCLALLAAYVAVTFPLAGHLRNRPVVVKLGYTPPAEILKVAAGEQRFALAEYTVVKVLFYYGSLVERWQQAVYLPPEYYNMYKTLETAVQLDPYNMDAYYFAQAAFTWEVGRAKDVNAMLEYGMKYRTWDWYLPYFVGFNSAYFLQDYDKAGASMRKAAELTGDPLFTNLAARYFYESGQTDLGLVFLDGMIARASDPKVRAIYQLRRAALLATRDLEAAVATFRTRFKRPPRQLAELVAAGIMPGLPQDPYGGTFYLDPQGKVRTTSKFARTDERAGAANIR